MERLKFKKGQVIWCNLDGERNEQRGMRPSVIVQNDVGNRFSTTTLIVPLTSSRTKAKLPVHVFIEKECFNNTKLTDSTALCEQVRVIDRRRISKVEDCILSDDIMDQINEALLVSFGVGKERKNKKIVYIRLDQGLGSEQRSNKPIPAIVLQNERGNKFSPTLIVAPCGYVRRKILPTQVLMAGCEAGDQFSNSIAMLEQIRVIDKSRVVKEVKEARFSQQVLEEIEKAILVSFGIELKPVQV